MSKFINEDSVQHYKKEGRKKNKGRLNGGSKDQASKEALSRGSNEVVHWIKVHRKTPCGIGIIPIQDQFRPSFGGNKGDIPLYDLNKYQAVVCKEPAFDLKKNTIKIIFGSASPLEYLFGMDHHLLVGYGEDTENAVVYVHQDLIEIKPD